METECKKIVLLKGLEPISDYHFRMVKSLLASDLKLTRKTQNEHNKIQIADLMAEKFPGTASVDKLIELYKDIEELKDRAKTLKNEKLKVIRRWKARGTTPVKQSKKDKLSSDESTSTTNKGFGPELINDMPILKKNKTTKTDESKLQLPQEQSQLSEPSVTSTQSAESLPQTPQMPPPAPSSSSSTKKRKDITNKTEESKRMKLFQEQNQLPESSTTSPCPTEGCLQTPQMPPPTPSSSSLTKKPRLKAVAKEVSKEEDFQRGPKEVMVLKATEPFVYAVSEGERKMFHATVATESEFFQVKVFDVSLKEKFIPKKVIAISDYIGRNGFLEVYNASSVSDVNADQKMEVSKRLIINATATPKIIHLYSQAPGTFVNGVFQVHKKIVWNDFIYYEIQDNTGEMEVVVYGRLTKINCKEGDKLQLICFELALGESKRQLRSVIHSFIKVIKARKIKETTTQS
ncbi:interferon-activable protein 203-like [Diceros bicornis minor]|uniref:interferon-activable protein 203-like n=1 Tax=Diceros bicornis minor TaxID=77932 RepID=UPI0026EF77B5|nr:interferon-activable protein 203-like [Diceros bicornis minor]